MPPQQPLQPNMQPNNNSKINTVLLIILIILVALGIFMFFIKKDSTDTNPENTVTPTGQTQTNQNPNGPDYQPSGNPTQNNQQPTDPNVVIKTDWGVSFKKASNWSVTSDSGNTMKLESGGDVITIQYITGNTITDTDAKFGNITYYYDATQHAWMVINPDEANGGSLSPVPVSPLSYNANRLLVLKGTGRWKTDIIPLSQTTFLKINISGGGLIPPLDDLAATVQKI